MSGIPIFNVNASGLVTVDGDQTVDGHIKMITGNSTGKFAVLSTGVHASYDFYNNGTSYFNGAVTVDATATFTGAISTPTGSTFAGAIKITGTGKIWNVKHGTLKPGKVTVEILKSLPTSSVQSLALNTKIALTNA